MTAADSTSLGESQSSFEVGETNALGKSSRLVHPIATKLSNGAAPSDLFNALAQEVKDTIVNEYMPAVIKSQQYKMYIRTKFLEERPVGPEDFITMRVLGRGGFGTVTCVSECAVL